MKNFILILTLLTSSYAFAAEDTDKQVPLPKATEPIIAELNVAKAKVVNDAIKKLQKVQIDLTKKGDLNGAMSIKKYIEGLQNPVNEETVSLLGEKSGPLFVKAEWGLDGNWVDVTKDVLLLVNQNTLDIPALTQIEPDLVTKHGDPASGTHKKIKFTFIDKTSKSFFDSMPIHLPLSKP